MRIFLPLLCVLCATPVHSIFDETCPRKDPPPGVLVLSPGSELVLTCRGHVTVNGVNIRNSSNSNSRGSSSDVNIIITGMKSPSDPSGGIRTLSAADPVYTAAPKLHSTSVRRSLSAEEMEDDYEEEGEEGSRVTRGLKSRPQWMWNGRTVKKGDGVRGEITFEKRRSALSLSSVRPTDSGRYTCYHKGRERFSLKVIVADPPEKPNLYCYKKSPSSKIRCEWKLQKPVTVRPNCYLFLSKSPTDAFHRFQCSYSSQASRCWCALNHDDEELRVGHMAYLCVTNIAGNATSALLDFTPMCILKPDPPTNVSVHKVEGHETRMKIRWALPASWKSHDNYYHLLYEIRYRPLKSSSDQVQIHRVKRERFWSITDAMPGAEYLIQVRTKEEYDGQWSDWSAAVNASSWIAPTSAITTIPVYPDTENSGSDDYVTDVAPTFTTISSEPVVSAHILWISAVFALLSVIMAAYIFRHKARLVSKLQNLNIVTQCGDSPQPPPPASAAPEVQALVTFDPPCYKEPPLSGNEEKNEEVRCLDERTETIHFNNTSYFFLQQSEENTETSQSVLSC